MARAAEDRNIGAFSAPAGRDAITLTYGLLGRRVSLTASFDEGVFDPELVASAVASAVEDRWDCSVVGDDPAVRHRE